jgi:hypothetical protein
MQTVPKSAWPRHTAAKRGLSIPPNTNRTPAPAAGAAGAHTADVLSLTAPPVVAPKLYNFKIEADPAEALRLLNAAFTPRTQPYHQPCGSSTRSC